jgi:LPXTG-motif cell wall-anchored protein
MNATLICQRAYVMLLVGLVCLAFQSTTGAQVKTSTNTLTHEATTETSVERAEVVHVEGNDLILKMEDGSLRHLANIPESDRVTVAGKEIGIHELKPGMKLEKTIKVITTPKTVVTTQSVTGKVWQIHPPTSVILTLENGENQKFNIPKDQKFSVDGQMVDAWGLRKGMRVTATKVVEEPVTEVEHQKQLTGQMPPPPQAPPADQPIVIAVLHVPATPAAPTELPKTGSTLPLLAYMGLLFLISSLALRAGRTS